MVSERLLAFWLCSFYCSFYQWASSLLSGLLKLQAREELDRPVSHTWNMEKVKSIYNPPRLLIWEALKGWTQWLRAWTLRETGSARTLCGLEDAPAGGRAAGVGLSCSNACPTPSDTTDRSPPGSSVHGILQARILEWTGWHLLLQGSSWCRDKTCISSVSCIVRWIVYHWATWETPKLLSFQCKALWPLLPGKGCYWEAFFF